MSLLLVGLSYRTAPVPVLERASIPAADVPKVLHELIDSENVAEALVVSTCNRVEVYADVGAFHGGVFDVSSVLARHAGGRLDEHLYVRYEQAAVHHLFRVAGGLDSMVVGETQILGQVRAAYTTAADEQTVGRPLHELAQRALSAGKRVHAETGIDRAGASLVGLGLDHASGAIGTLAGRGALIVGAGSMGALAGATLRRAGIGRLVIANRTAANAERLARSLSGRAAGLDRVDEELAAADLLVASTGATGLVVTAETVEQAMRRRAGRPLVVLDLALPRDVDPAVAGIAGITYIDLETLQRLGDVPGDAPAIAHAERIVEEEVAGYLAWERSVEVAPTVVALRTRANEVVEAELARLDARRPGLDPALRAEIARTVRRTVSTLLHAPTVRVKELASSPDGDAYAEALRTLFGLTPGAVDSVSTPEDDQ